MRPLILILPVLSLPLAACDETMMTDLNSAMGLAPEAPEGPAPLPPAVAAVLPPGTNPALVFTDNTGCYLFSVEVTDPPSGYPLTDAAGNPICEGQPAAVPAAGLPAAQDGAA